MMEMHFFKKTEQVKIPSPEKHKEVTVRDLFYFLYEISEWSQSCPLVCPSEQENKKVFYLLFRNFAFTGDAFWQIFGSQVCIMNSRWKLDVFGTSYPSQETVWLTLEEQDGCYYGVQNTISGKTVDTIDSLCLRIDCNSLKLAHILQILFQSVDWRKGIIVTDWKYYNFFVEEKIEHHWENSCFCYGSVGNNTLPEDYVQALKFTQKVTLWIGFLRDGFDYKEFEWLYMLISENAVENRIEWELALHTAMHNLGYTIQVLRHEFELYDVQSQRKYFNFNSRQYAQMALLKILFPINV